MKRTTKTLKQNLRLLRNIAGTSVLLLALTTHVNAQKFLGNIFQSTAPSNFTQFWNQVTPENSSKWDACEPSRDNYNWGNLDNAYNFANQNGLPFKGHTFVWGSQEPGWIGGLSQSEQRAEVEEWIRDYFARYPGVDYMDVVNEPLHAPASYRNALGGSGATGWDWVVTSFEIARQYAPSGCQLLINEYGIISDPNAAQQYRNIIDILNSRGLIDGIGIQCHSFNMDNVSTGTMNQVLGILAGSGLPIYVSELDMRGSDQQQLQRYQEKFPIFWEHSSVQGVTLWGYIQGTMWESEAWLMTSGGSMRPAMQWLMDYVSGSGQCGGGDYGAGTPLRFVMRGTTGTEQVRILVGNNEVANFTLCTQMADYRCSTGAYSGELYAEFYNDQGDRDVQIDYVSVDGEIRQAEDRSYNTGVYQDGSCGGAYSEMLHCNGAIGFGEVGVVPCDPTTITPYISVSDGSWQQISSVSVSSGTKVELGPQPSSGGSWSWTGCGVSGTSREQTLYPTSSCVATATYTNACGAQSTQNFSITVSGGTGDDEVWLEAECGTVGSAWNVNSSTSASNNQYVTVQPGTNSTASAPSSSSGHITYSFDVSASGSYDVWARVITPSPTDDSFWLRMDGGSWTMWNNIGPNSNWAWEQALTYSLSAGSHTLTIAYREDGAQLDKLYIGNSTPSGEGSAATNCSGGDYSITVRARGTAGSEQISLNVGGTAIQTWTLGTSMSNYTATTDLSGGITVEFLNDDGTNRDVQVDYIQVPGATWQAENQATNTGVWQDGSCGGSNSEWLHCGGYIGFTAYKSAEESVDEPAFELTKALNVSVFPNPMTNGMLNIQLAGTEGLSLIRIVDLNGKVVKELSAQDEEFKQVQLDLNPGLYIVSIINGDNNIVKKLAVD